MLRVCEICEQSAPSAVSCPDHAELAFHVSCFVLREELTGFGCPSCEAEERQGEEL